MTIDNKTSINITNKYKNVTGIYTLYYFTETIGPERLAHLKALIHSEMTVSITTDIALKKIGKVFKGALTEKYSYP